MTGLRAQIITFDETGISGHANHRAINAALVKTVNRDDNLPPVFQLRTTRSVLSKYSSMFFYPYVRLSHLWRLNHPLPLLEWDPEKWPVQTLKREFLASYPKFGPEHFRSGHAHPFSTHPTLLVNSPYQYLKSRTAFKQHRTQIVWFRRLYMMFSRYMWFNELEKVVPVHLRVVNLGKIRDARQPKNSL